MSDARGDVLSISASSLRPEGMSVSLSGLDMSVQSGSLSAAGAGEDVGGADQAGRLTSSTEADWGGRSHGGPGHGVALPAAGRGWALSRAHVFPLPLQQPLANICAPTSG